MPEKTTNLNLPIPLGNENVNRQYFVDLIQAIDSGAVSEEQLAEQVKRLTEGKQDVVRLADNFKAPMAAITEYPQGFSVFYVGGGTGGQGAAWATAAGATETFGWVETVRTGSAGYQTFTEMYSGTDTTATSGNRQFKRNKRDSNSFWQPFERVLDQDDLVTHNADYVRQPGYGATAGTGAAYTVTLSPAPAALVDGLAITIVPHVANTVADPTLKIGALAAMPIRRQSGGQFAAGAIKAGQPLSLIKVGSYFLARSTSPTGTATADKVLSGYTFHSAAVPDGASGTLTTLRSTQLTPNTVLGKGVEIWSKKDVGGGYGIAVDTSGNVYCMHNVATGSKAIRKLDANGNEIWSKTDVGGGYEIAVDAFGNVYCTHRLVAGSKAIRKLDANGNEIWSKTDVTNPGGIAVDASGNVYCVYGVDFGGKAIQKLDANGTEIWSKTDVGYGNGITVDASGNVYCTHNVATGWKAIRKLSTNGEEYWSNTDVGYAWGVAVDASGNVYCVHYSNEAKKVRKLSASGNEIWSKTDVASGFGITAETSGNVYCAHYVAAGSKAIRKLNTNGNEIWSKTDIGYPFGLAVDGSGNVYCSHVNSSGKIIRKLDDGTYYDIVI